MGLFSVKVSGTELYVVKTAHGSHLLLPRSFRQASCRCNVKNIPTTTKFRGISVLLLLCGVISLNPGPVSFGVINCRSVRNKGPTISDTVFSVTGPTCYYRNTHMTH